MKRTTETESASDDVVVSSSSYLLQLAKVTLGMWGFYFIAKLALYWMELIGFHTWVNLAFAAFILIPVRHTPTRRAKQAVTVLLAVALLYYDSWLPPIGRVLSQASLLSSFSAAYLFELAGRFISLPVVAMLVAACALYWFLLRWLRLDTVVIMVMIGVPIMVADRSVTVQPQLLVEDEPDWYAQSALPMTTSQPAFAESATPASAIQAAQLPLPTEPGQSEQAEPPMQQSTQISELAAGNTVEDSVLDMDKVLKKFFVQESARSISFPAPKPDDIPFDVIFIHVCSLSWDDLKVTGLDQHPLWQRFDILLTRFNSASTYSGPAAIRMQRATCGQSNHTNLYSPAPEKCYLMDSLKRDGFEPSLVLNHDGHFDDFLKIVQRQGGFNIPPLPLNGVLITQYAFDNTPIYDDLSVLGRWLENRQKSSSLRMAMYYNSVSLHDGNHLSGVNAKMNSRENFKIRLSKLLDDLDKFMQDIEKSGRRAVVAMVPEHGAALRGDKMQIAGLREIPSPAITLVPVGIKVIGTNFQRTGDTVKIAKPTSYLAISHVVARFLENSPYTRNSYVPSDYVANIPVTPFVSQNSDVVMAGYKGRYYLLQDASGWVDYTDF